MTEIGKLITTGFQAALLKIAHSGFSNAARGLGGMIGCDMTLTASDVSVEPIEEIPQLLGGPEADGVGIYLRFKGDVSGQVMIVIPYAHALELTDMMLGQPAGMTASLGGMERSALSELGNLTGTFFLNAISDLTGNSARPSPPVIMVDMVGAILDVVVSSTEDLGSRVLIFKAVFMCGSKELKINFWVVPDAPTLLKLINHGNSEL